MEKSLLNRFQALLATRMGLQVREQDRADFENLIAARTRALKHTGANGYYFFLSTETPESDEEWHHLAGLLTNRESYFFRDKGQMALLRERLLPELIERNRWKRALRLWSAGCSTGEEPYSLAILVDELLPDVDNWNLTILGTDINEAVLRQARSGLYTSWSFRTVDPEILRRYFRQEREGHRINDRLRSMVQFQNLNLLRDEYPNDRVRTDMDLILCRNVFIYFDQEAVRSVLRKFSSTLSADGYLMTGHAEVHRQSVAPMRPVAFPQSVVYQKPVPGGTGSGAPPARAMLARPAPTSPQAPPPRPVPRQAAPSRSVLESAESLLNAARPLEAMATIEPLLKGKPEPAALAAAARASADLGQHDRAAELCHRAIEIDPLAVEPYRILAAVAEEQGNLEEARGVLKKVIYLAPSLIPAYIDLADLYDRDGARELASRTRTSALRLLEAMPADVIVEGCSGASAAEMVERLRKQSGQHR